MKFLSVLWCLFLGVQTFGEIPFEQLKGLHTSMRDDAKAFSPLYGFAALKGNVLKNIRFYGNYGKESYGFMDGGSGVLAPKPGFNPGLIHPAFLPKRPGSPGGDVVEAAEQERRNAENLFEVPLDPTSTLVQWLFPSVDGVNFVANDRSNDPVGYFALTRIEQAQKQKELEKVERQIAAIKARDDYVAYDVLTGKDRGTHEIGRLLKPLSKQKGDLQTALRVPIKSFAGILRVIHDFMNRGIVDHDSFVGAMIEALPNVPTIPGETSKSQIFAEILYSALIEDGTFPGGNWDWMVGRSAMPSMASASGDGSWMSLSRSDDGMGPLTHNPLYPKHIALHALLGYMWSICDHKSELVEAYDAIGFIKPEQKARALREAYTEANYGEIKRAIMEGSPLNLGVLFAGYGYEVYEKSLPPALGFSLAKVPSLYGQGSHSYPDCGETALRNFFNILTYVGGGNFNGERLTLASSKMDQIREFYGTFSTQSKQLSQPARDAWSNIIINLNANPQSDPSSNFVDINDVYYRGRNTQGSLPEGFRFAEIASTPHGIINVLNVFARLTNDAILSEPWVTFDITKLNESPDLFAQIIRKLDRLCTIFSREGFALDWRINGGKDLKQLHGSFIFSINGQDVFAYHINQGHFVLAPLVEPSTDWRMNYLKGEEYVYHPFMAPFFGVKNEKIPFWRGDIKEGDLSSIVEFWKKRFKGRNFDHPSILASLRLIKKFYGNVLDDQYASRQVFQLLASLFESGEQMDFVLKSLRSDAPLKEWIDMIWKKQNKVILDFYLQTEKNQNAIFAQYILLSFEDDEKFIGNVVQYLSQFLPSLADGASIEDQRNYQQQLKDREKLWGLIKAKIDRLDPKSIKERLNKIDQNGQTPLLYAFKSLDRSLFQQIIPIEGVFDPAYVFSDGATWLHHAVLAKNADIIPWLLSQGILIDAKANGLSALDYCFLNSQGVMPDIAKVLVESGADVNTLNIRGMSPLSYAYQLGIQTKDYSLLDFMLKHGGRMDSEIMYGQTLMSSILSDQNVGGLKVLIENGLIPSFGTDLLREAFYINNQPMIELLLSSGAALPETGKYGEPLLEFAINASNWDLVTLVIERISNPDQELRYGSTALSLLAQNRNRIPNYADLADILIRKGASLYVPGIMQGILDTTVVSPETASAWTQSAFKGVYDMTQFATDYDSQPFILWLRSSGVSFEDQTLESLAADPSKLYKEGILSYVTQLSIDPGVIRDLLLRSPIQRVWNEQDRRSLFDWVSRNETNRSEIKRQIWGDFLKETMFIFQGYNIKFILNNYPTEVVLPLLIKTFGDNPTLGFTNDEDRMQFFDWALKNRNTELETALFKGWIDFPWPMNQAGVMRYVLQAYNKPSLLTLFRKMFEVNSAFSFMDSDDQAAFKEWLAANPDHGLRFPESLVGGK